MPGNKSFKKFVHLKYLFWNLIHQKGIRLNTEVLHEIEENERR